MSKPTPLEQAKELEKRTTEARWAFRKCYDLQAKELTESEVKFRFDTIDGVLIMALNDMDRLVKAWEEMI